MRGHFYAGLSAVPVLLALFANYAFGRQIEDWPYDRLFKQSDLILIVKPLSTREAGPELGINPQEEYLTAVVTKFTVLHVLKGEHQPRQVEITHFRLKDGVAISNGPLLVSFRVKSALDESNYLIFLKRGKDGGLEFVSGQFDPELSVKMLIQPPALETRPKPSLAALEETSNFDATDSSENGSRRAGLLVLLVTFGIAAVIVGLLGLPLVSRVCRFRTPDRPNQQ